MNYGQGGCRTWIPNSALITTTNKPTQWRQQRMTTLGEIWIICSSVVGPVNYIFTLGLSLILDQLLLQLLLLLLLLARQRGGVKLWCHSPLSAIVLLHSHAQIDWETHRIFLAPDWRQQFFTFILAPNWEDFFMNLNIFWFKEK